MIDYHIELRNALKTIGIPVHYELSLHSGLKTPCISYMELTNFVQTSTDITDISTIQYQIKVWGTDIAQLQGYAKAIDTLLRPLGWQRNSAAELYDTNSAMIQKVLTYSATGLETNL